MTNISQNYLLIVQDDSYRKKKQSFFLQCGSLVYRNNYEGYNMKTTEYFFIFTMYQFCGIRHDPLSLTYII